MIAFTAIVVADALLNPGNVLVLVLGMSSKSGVATHGGNLVCGTANSDCKLTSDGSRNISHRVDPKGGLS